MICDKIEVNIGVVRKFMRITFDFYLQHHDIIVLSDLLRSWKDGIGVRCPNKKSLKSARLSNSSITIILSNLALCIDLRLE